VLGHGEQLHFIRGVVVALVAHVLRRLGDDAEDLQAHVPLEQPRHIHLSSARPLVQIAIPQQRVGVEIREEEPRVQRRAPLRRRVGRLPEDRVHLGIHAVGFDFRADEHRREDSSHDPQGDPFLHRALQSRKVESIAETASVL
jgi:1,6-anhydro-N-acetylmuramate kinase